MTSANQSSEKEILSNLKLSAVSITAIKTNSKNRSSFVWNYFGTLHLLENESIHIAKTKYFCIECLKDALSKTPDAESTLFQKSNIKSYGTNISTSNLSKHLIKHEIYETKSVEESTTTIREYFNIDRRVVSQDKSARDDKFTLVRDFVLLCCRDLLPFSFVEGEGFIDFMEKRGVSRDNIPCRTTIPRALVSVYNDCKSWLINEINMNCPHSVALTFDIWSDKYRRRSYLTFTLHYVDQRFELINLTLSTRHFPKRHTGENILSEIETLCDQFGLAGKQIYMVTDGASNNIKACTLGNYAQLICYGHGLHNLVVVDGLKKCGDLNDLVKKVRNIVKALRYRTSEFESLSNDHIALAKEMSDMAEILGESDFEDEETVEDDVPDDVTPKPNINTLKLDVKTRWNSILTMLESVASQDKNVVNLMLRKTDHEDLILSNYEYRLIKELIKFLQNFKKITKIFSGDKYATINFAMLFRSEMYSLIETEPQDSEEIKELKDKMMANFNKRFPITETMVLASMLDPRFVNLMDVKSYLNQAALTPVQFLTKCYKNFSGSPTSSSDATSSTATTYSTASSNPRPNRENSLSYVQELAERHSTLSYVAEASSSLDQSAFERECYLLFSMSSKVTITNVLEFWRDNSKAMPKLSIMAGKIYCVPATSTPSERVFSTAGIIVNNKRSRISPDVIDMVIFNHNNYQFLKKKLWN